MEEALMNEFLWLPDCITLCSCDHPFHIYFLKLLDEKKLTWQLSPFSDLPHQR
jgi:hypothetical protein